MKKLFIVLLILISSLALVACEGKNVDTLKVMIQSMELEDSNTEWDPTDYEGTLVTGQGAFLMYDEEYGYLTVVYPGKDQAAMLDFEMTSNEDGTSTYITYFTIAYFDLDKELSVEYTYTSVEVDGYRVDMSIDEWIETVRFYSVETILNILIDLELIVKETA